MIYNTVTAIFGLIIVLMLAFTFSAFQMPILPGQQNGNFAGKIDTLPMSPGLSTSGGDKGALSKGF